jgi:hypothetical protein
LFSFGYTLNNNLYDGAGQGSGVNSALPIFTGSTGNGKRWFTSGTPAQISRAYCGSDGLLADLVTPGGPALTNTGWDDGGGTTAAGFVFSNLHDSQNQWLGTGVSPTANTIGCTNGQHVLCLQGKLAPTAPPTTLPPTTPPPNVNGDPQFTGKTTTQEKQNHNNNNNHMKRTMLQIGGGGEVDVCIWIHPISHHVLCLTLVCLCSCSVFVLCCLCRSSRSILSSSWYA